MNTTELLKLLQSQEALLVCKQEKANFEVRNELYILKNDKINRLSDKFYEKSRRKSSHIIL